MDLFKFINSNGLAAFAERTLPCERQRTRGLMRVFIETDCVEQDDCTTHAFASESACMGDLRAFYEDDEEAACGKGVVGQLYLAARDTIEYLNAMIYFYQVRAEKEEILQGNKSASIVLTAITGSCMEVGLTLALA